MAGIFSGSMPCIRLVFIISASVYNYNVMIACSFMSEMIITLFQLYWEHNEDEIEQKERIKISKIYLLNYFSACSITHSWAQLRQ